MPIFDIYADEKEFIATLVPGTYFIETDASGEINESRYGQIIEQFPTYGKTRVEWIVETDDETKKTEELMNSQMDVHPVFLCQVCQRFQTFDEFDEILPTIDCCPNLEGCTAND